MSRRDPYDLARVPGLTPGEKRALKDERTLNQLKQSKALKVVTLVTACAAITQLVFGDPPTRPRSYWVSKGAGNNRPLMQVSSAGKLRYGERTTGYNIVSWLDWLMLRHGYQGVLCKCKSACRMNEF
jgi:hypothetical protein